MLYVAEQYSDTVLFVCAVVITSFFIIGFYLLCRYLISHKRVVSLTRQEQEFMSSIINRSEEVEKPELDFDLRRAVQKCTAKIYTYSEEGEMRELIILIWSGLNVVGVIDTKKQTFESFIISEAGKINALAKGLVKTHLDTPLDLVRFLKSLTGQKTINQPPLE